MPMRPRFRQHRWPPVAARNTEFAALAVLVGFSTNTVSKTVVAFSLGDRSYAYALTPGLILMAAAAWGAWSVRAFFV